MPIVLNGVTYFQMADAIYASNLPAGMDAYLGYVNGSWPDYTAILERFPGVPVFGLDVFGAGWTGDGTDVEPGDADIAQGVASMQAELARGVDRPIAYGPASWATAMVNAYTAAGIARVKYRLLTAHYTFQHICGPATCGYGPGSDGCQWQRGGPFDLSILAPNFLQAAPYPTPLPPPPPSPPVPIAGGKKMYQDVTINTDPNGNGDADLVIPAGLTWLSCTPLLAAPGTPGITPATPGNYDLGKTAFTVGANAGAIRVQITGTVPNGGRGVRVVFG